jgi:hypothetical protein
VGFPGTETVAVACTPPGSAALGMSSTPLFEESWAMPAEPYRGSVLRNDSFVCTHNLPLAVEYVSPEARTMLPANQTQKKRFENYKTKLKIPKPFC